MARGGKRDGAGRPAGVPNKATAEVKAIAQQYTDEAITTLAEIMKGVEHPAAARVSAAQALLDRGHGKAKQAIEASGPEGAPIQINRVERVIVRPKH